jgi:hypothetical protein
MAIEYTRQAGGKRLAELGLLLHDEIEGVEVRVPASQAVGKGWVRPRATGLQLVGHQQTLRRYGPFDAATEQTIRRSIIEESPGLLSAGAVVVGGYIAQRLKRETFLTLIPDEHDQRAIADERAGIWSTIDNVAASMDLEPAADWPERRLPDVTIMHIPLGAESPDQDNLQRILQLARPIIQDSIGMRIVLQPVRP